MLGIAAAQIEQAALLREHGVRKLPDGLCSVGGRRRPQQCGCALRIAALDSIDLPGNAAEMRLNRVAQPGDIGLLRRIVRGEALEPVELRRYGGQGVLIVRQKFGTGRQEIATRRAFGTAHFQEQRVGLVFDLDGMDDPVAVATRLADQQHGSRTDRHKHKKSGREQQDLQQRAPVPPFRRHRQIAR